MDWDWLGYGGMILMERGFSKEEEVVKGERINYNGYGVNDFSFAALILWAKK